jgi:hypothetical protein
MVHPLAFTCPKTGWPVESGLEIGVNRASLQEVQPVTLRLVCPHCGKAHVWKLADGWIREPQAGSQYGEWRAV